MNIIVKGFSNGEETFSNMCRCNCDIFGGLIVLKVNFI